MTTAQVVETSVTVNNNIPAQDYVHRDDQTQPFEIYFFVLFFCLASSSPCCKDQFAVSYFSTSLIVLIQVYNWEIRHHSLVCCYGLADILGIPGYPGKVKASVVQRLDIAIHRINHG